VRYCEILTTEEAEPGPQHSGGMQRRLSLRPLPARQVAPPVQPRAGSHTEYPHKYNLPAKIRIARQEQKIVKSCIKKLLEESTDAPRPPQ
jgi:hypothetical protein